MKTKILNIQLTRSTKLVVSFKTLKTHGRKHVQSSRLKFKWPTQRWTFGGKVLVGLGAFFRHEALIPVIVALLGLGGTLYFGLQTGRVRKVDPVVSFSLPTPPVPKKVESVPKGLPKSEPTHIKIASVGIDYPVVQVGRDASGAMETPPLFDQVTGWYKYSPTPGEIGPSIIVGHVDTYKGPNVFWRLHDIKPNDIIEITRSDGSVVKFKVEALQQFSQDNFPNAQVYGNLDHAGLRLITCGGTFNRQTGHYSDNTVVFASIVNS